MRMALVSIRLKHVAWRHGRPRFQPGPKLRRLGFKGADLKRPDGTWMDLAEAEAWVKAKEAEIITARAQRPWRSLDRPIEGGRGALSGRRVLLYTLKDLFEDFFASPSFAGRLVVDGRREQKPLAAATVRDYRGKAKALEHYDQELWLSDVTLLSQPIIFGLYEQLWRDKGLSQARGIIAVLSAAIAWGRRRGKVKLAENPCHDLDMQMPAPRVRVGEISEMRALVATADRIGRPEIGDAIMLGLWTGQRQTDRLALVDEGLANGRRIFKQSKTGAIVAIREAPELEARLRASRLRRQAWKVQPMENLVVMDERAEAQFQPDWYRHVYAEVRAAGAIACPSLSTFRDQDLRDTAVTWMALGQSTIPEIIAVTGHSAQSAHTILRHYLARHPELADAAIAKMVAWYEKGASTG